MGFRAWGAEAGFDRCEIVVSALVRHLYGDRFLELYLIDPTENGALTRHRVDVPRQVPGEEDVDEAALQEAARDVLIEEFRQRGDEVRRRGAVRCRDEATDGDLLRRLALLPNRHGALREIRHHTEDDELREALSRALRWGPIRVRIVE